MPSTSGCFIQLLLTLRAHGKDVLWDDFNATRKALAAQGPNPEAAIKGTAWPHYCVNESETETLWHEARDVYQQMRKPRPFGSAFGRHHARLAGPPHRLPPGHHRQPAPARRPGHRRLRHCAACLSVIVISEIVHLFKPDPAIFRAGLEQARIMPAEAIFVGDRPDNDIGPAKAAGMKTVRFKRGIQYVYYNPDDPALTAE